METHNFTNDFLPYILITLSYKIKNVWNLPHVQLHGSMKKCVEIAKANLTKTSKLKKTYHFPTFFVIFQQRISESLGIWLPFGLRLYKTVTLKKRFKIYSIICNKAKQWWFFFFLNLNMYIFPNHLLIWTNPFRAFHLLF